MSTNIRIVSKVDDEFDITDLFRDAIGRIVGISVFAFNDPIKGFEHFAKNKEEYVLVISDLRMPGPKGLELLKKVKTKRQQVRTILMSAYAKFKVIWFSQNYLKKQIINQFIQKKERLNRVP